MILKIFDTTTLKFFYLCLFAFISSLLFSNEISDKKSLILNKNYGFVSNHPKSIFQSKTGHIWIGTSSGFVKLLPDSLQTFKTDTTLCFMEYDENTLWIGTTNGVNIYKKGVLSQLPEIPYKNQNFIFDIFKDSKKRIWIASWNGVYRLDENGCKHFNKNNGLPNNDARSILEDEDNRIWVASSGGLLLYKENKGFDQISLLGNLSEIVARDIIEYKPGLILVASFNGLFLYDTISNQTDILFKNSVYDLHKGSDGTVYGVTDNNILILKNKELSFYNDSDGLLAKRPKMIFEDREKNLWILSSNNGIQKLTEFPFFNFPLKFNNESIKPRCILAIKEELYLGTIDGLFKYSSKKELKKIIGSLVVNCLCYNKKSDQLILGADKGLYIVKNNHVQNIPHTKNPFNTSVYAVTEDLSGRIWFGTKEYLFEYSDGQINKYKPKEIDPIQISTIKTGLNSGLMVGSAAGLFHFENQKFRKVGSEPSRVHNIFKINNFHIMVAKIDGLFVFDNDKLRKVYSKGLFPFEQVLSSLKDNLGNLWLTNTNEIIKISEKQLSDFVSNEKYDLSYSVFGKSKGLSSSPLPIYTSPVSTIFNNKLIFLTENGLSCIKLNQSLYNSDPSPTSIENVYLDNQEIQFCQHFSITPETKRIGFEFTCLSYRLSEGIKYKYRLLGYENIWTHTDDRKISYNNLSPGEYTFEVIAANSDGVWSEKPTSVSFTVPRPFYKTWWFYTAAAIVISFLMNLFYKGLRFLFKSVIFWNRSNFIGPHKIKHIIGTGGMGTVYKAISLKTQSTVALKVLNDNVTDNSIKERFLQEGIICEDIQHPNVIEIYDKGEDKGRLYYAMEYVSGRTLRQIINDETLSISSAMAITGLLNEILHNIHSYGVVHRDIKPDNLMFAKGIDLGKTQSVQDAMVNLHDKLKLLDFGLAKMLGNTALTQTGLLAGTVYYLPPESLEERKDWYPEIDFYSMGIMLYEMLTFANPFEGDDMLNVIYQVMNHVPAPPHIINPDIPEDISDFAMKLIEKDTDRRLKDYHGIKKAFDKIVDKS